MAPGATVMTSSFVRSLSKASSSSVERQSSRHNWTRVDDDDDDDDDDGEWHTAHRNTHKFSYTTCTRRRRRRRRRRRCARRWGRRHSWVLVMGEWSTPARARLEARRARSDRMRSNKKNNNSSSNLCRLRRQRFVEARSRWVSRRCSDATFRASCRVRLR